MSLILLLNFTVSITFSFIVENYGRPHQRPNPQLHGTNSFHQFELQWLGVPKGRFGRGSAPSTTLAKCVLTLVFAAG